MSRRLWAWIVFVALFASVNFAGNLAAPKARKGSEPLYHYATAVSGLVAYALLLGIALAIAVGTKWRELFALRRPRTRWTIGGPLLILVGIFILSAILEPVLHGGREQGLLPKHWEPSHAGAYAANFAVIAVLAPVVEELIFRGMGYTLLEPHGRTLAIAVVGVAFGLAHGLVFALPGLVALGAGLAWLRSKTTSVFPGMATHSLFNTIALLFVLFR